MRVTRTLCALLLFGPLAVEASEVAGLNGSNIPMTTAGSAANRDVQPVASDSAILSHRAATPQQATRTNADRLRALLAAQARGRVVRQPISRPVDLARAPTFMGGPRQERLDAIGAQSSASTARQVTRDVVLPARVASSVAVRAVPTLHALAIHSTNGLPRAPSLAVVGGPVAGNGVHNSSIDGTSLRHKF